MENKSSAQADVTAEMGGQYSLVKILGIWAAAAVPMGILGMVVYPALTPDRVADPLKAGSTRLILLTAGLVWLFVLSLIILWREEGDIRWSTMKRRFWLNTPRDPKTGESRRKLWLWAIPFSILALASTQLLGPSLIKLLTGILPFLTPAPGFDPMESLLEPEVQAQVVGAWGFYGLFLVLAVFNILGEEFLFRGVLLPKMEGVFGKWDWVANGALFGAYHLHQPWVILAAAFGGIFFFAFPAKHWHSTWLAIIAHSVGNIIFIPLILLLVLGLI